MTDPPLPPVHKTPMMLAVEMMFGGRDVRLVLVALYNQLGSQAAVARRLGITSDTVRAWFAMLGIRTRSRAAVIDAGDPPTTTARTSDD